jgi:uncharacterized membrane protein YgcG
VELDTELWDWFFDVLNQSIQENQKDWKELLKKQKMKILCYKYFTKKELIKPEKLEALLKKDLKKYFSSLQNYANLEGFRDKVENLPSDLLTNLIRYIFYKSKGLQEKIKISKEEFKERVAYLTTERMKAVENLSMISKKYQSVFDLQKLKELYNNGVFFEDNLINRGVNEYITKLFGYSKISAKIKEVVPGAFVKDLKYQAENCPAYINHIQEIKQDQTQQFFTEKGFQIGKRFENEINIAKQKNLGKDSEYIIDKDSVFKEPTGKLTSVSWEDSEAVTGGETDEDGESSSGGSGGGGGSSFGGGGGGSLSGGNFPGDIDPDIEGVTGDGPLGEEGDDGTGPAADGEIPLPKDDQGFPVDFGTEESNPEAAETADDSDSNQNKEKK